MKTKHLLYFLVLSLGATGCFDLNKDPEGVLSSNKPFRSTGEIQNYVNQFYETGLRVQDITMGGGSGIAGLDTYSDNLVGSSPVDRTNGSLALSGASSLGTYRHIRNVNFLLNNQDNCEKNTEFNRLIGEAYYFRAWYYYQLFKDYGGVAIVTEPLDPDAELMKRGRNTRTEVADFILQDLDKAIELLPEQNNSASMRVHRDVARTLKSEVALFEGTWEKYHKAAGDPFFDDSVTDAKINEYLQVAAAAAKQVIERNVWKIHNTGAPMNDYRSVFQGEVLDNNSEVLWYKRYDGDQVGNSVDRYLNKGGGAIGVTASLVDDYLTIDGKPFIGGERLAAKRVFGKELLPALRDPRLAQTVVTPGQQLRPDDPVGYTLPPFGKSGFEANTTGYSMLKHVQIDWTGDLDAENKGGTPAIQFRYADVLLNYAEALAEQGGAAHADEIIAAVQPLRDRAGMPAMDFDREYNTSEDYPFRGLDKYIQAVRRERRVEQALEGRRFYDILRWAAADELLVGMTPVGVLFTGSDLPGNYPDLSYDQDNAQIYLTGNPGDADRYVLPIPPASLPDGYQFNVKRDYLLPFQQRMTTLTGGLWEQNPGW